MKNNVNTLYSINTSIRRKQLTKTEQATPIKKQTAKHLIRVDQLNDVASDIWMSEEF